MGLQKNVAKVEAETEDELEQIMNDIENLQEEMASEEEAERKRRTQQETKPALRAVPGGLDEDSEPSADFESGPEADSELEAAVEAEVEAELTHFHGSSEDAALEETLAALEQEEAAEGSLLSVSTLSTDETVYDAETEDSVPMEEPVTTLKHRNVTNANPRAGSGVAEEGAMTLSVSGAMTLKLRYENADQEVEVALSPDTLTVRLSDGSEFRIPIQGRRAA